MRKIDCKLFCDSEDEENFESWMNVLDLPPCNSSAYVNRRNSFIGNFDIYSNKEDLPIISPISDNVGENSKNNNFDQMKTADDKALIFPTSIFLKETLPQNFESLEVQKPKLKPRIKFNGIDYKSLKNICIRDLLHVVGKRVICVLNFEMKKESGLIKQLRRVKNENKSKHAKNRNRDFNGKFI